jgi:hypothetical protein
MTVLATSHRLRPASHAFCVPVVREVAPRRTDLAAGAGW